MDPFTSVPEEDVRKEKQKARELRKTQWWKRKCAEGRCYYCGRDFKPSELTMDHRTIDQGKHRAGLQGLQFEEEVSPAHGVGRVPEGHAS